jgi:UDP-N-acetylmuramoyl-tripeptide--D-alanyl-D-alanine ligase
VHRLIRVGLHPERAELTADNLWSHELGTTFTLNGREKVETPLIGRHNVVNCLLAIQVALTLGVEMEMIQKSLPSFKPMPGRLSLKTIDDVHFLDDSYNSNPTSFRAALETLKGFKTRGRKGVVCGDMMELGDGAEALHRQAGQFLAGLFFDFVVATGPLMVYLAEEAVSAGYPSEKIFRAKNSSDAGKICQKLASNGDLVLVKGSRSMQMEKIFECFMSCSSR